MQSTQYWQLHTTFWYTYDIIKVQNDDKDRFSNIMIHDIEHSQSTFDLHCALSFAINNIRSYSVLPPFSVHNSIEVLFVVTFYHFIYVPIPNEFRFIIVSLHLPNEYVKYIFCNAEASNKLCAVNRDALYTARLKPRSTL